ncbi:uncharacterized protein LOC134184053 [Corticium candelabrum]|uniref:uncharacterized protein LOC134184053 n=1 Tax=Corticium candelabrum TaxID=121492 RepID=UPI002E3150E6|nr:uncharacterized protein LOC134184053 [Corticium candelabrum]
MHQKDQVCLAKCVLVIIICAWCPPMPVLAKELTPGSGKTIPSRQCYLQKKALKKECKIDRSIGWIQQEPRCRLVSYDKIIPLPQTMLDPRVDSLEFPSIILNASYYKMWCIWTSKASAHHRYYVAVEKLIANDANNSTKLCLHIDKERRTCQKGSLPAKLPVAVTTTTGKLHIRVEFSRGDAQEASVTLIGRYTEVQISTHVPGQTTTAQPLYLTDQCLNKTNPTAPMINHYYFDPVKEDCIKFRRAHANRASRYTGHEFKDMRTCRQQCVFQSMKRLRSKGASSSAAAKAGETGEVLTNS